MFRLATGRGCRHQAIARHLGESVAPCGSSCDACAGWDRLAESRPIENTRRRAPAAAAGDRGPAFQGYVGADADELVGALRALRKRLATARAVPAYVIFSDATLLDIAAARPRSAEALLAISGIGPKKLELYGAAVLEAVARGAAAEKA
jgi:ATP-dependent DNA helicase RecQ